MKAKLVRESLNEISEIPESDKELIAQARDLSFIKAAMKNIKYV